MLFYEINIIHNLESKYIEIIDNEKKIIYKQKSKGNIRLFFGM